jgi:hypothetical protein
MLGQGAELDSSHGAAGSAGNVRSRICSRIITDVGPIAARWGVRVINFQLEVCVPHSLWTHGFVF